METIWRQLEQQRGQDHSFGAETPGMGDDGLIGHQVSLDRKLGLLTSVQQGLTGVNSAINALAEQYPTLYSYASMQHFQQDIFDAEEHLQAARRLYNSNASLYNQRNINIYDSSYYFGDADGNKKVDAADALYLKRHLADWEDYRELPQKTNVSWMDEASPANLMILERHIAGWKDYEMLPYTDNFFE